MENICDDSGFSTMFDIGDFDMEEGASVGINKVGGNLGSSSIISENEFYDDGMKFFGVENAFEERENEREDLPKLETLPVKIVEKKLRHEDIPIYGGEEEDEIPVKIVDLNNDFEDALLVHKNDIVYNGSGYSLKLHGGCVRALGYQDCDGETCMAGNGLKSFFKKAVNKAKDLGKKVLKTAKSVGKVAVNVVGNAAKDFVNSGIAENILNTAVNIGLNKGIGKVANLASNLLKGKGYEAGWLDYDFNKYYDDSDIYITMKGLKGSGKSNNKGKNKGESAPETKSDGDKDDNGKGEMDSQPAAPAAPPAKPKYTKISIGDNEDFPEQNKLKPSSRYVKKNTTVLTNDKGEVIQITKGLPDDEDSIFVKGHNALILYAALRNQQDDEMNKMRSGVFGDPGGAEEKKIEDNIRKIDNAKKQAQQNNGKKANNGNKKGNPPNPPKKKSNPPKPPNNSKKGNPKASSSSSSSSSSSNSSDAADKAVDPNQEGDGEEIQEFRPLSAEEMAELGYFGGLWQRFKEIGLMIYNRQNFLNGFLNLAKAATYHQTPVDYSVIKSFIVAGSIGIATYQSWAIIGPIVCNTGRGKVFEINKEKAMDIISNDTQYIYYDATGQSFSVSPAERVSLALELQDLTKKAYRGEITDESKEMNRLMSLYNKFPSYYESTLKYPRWYAFKTIPQRFILVGSWFQDSIATTIDKLGICEKKMHALREMEKKAKELGEWEANLTQQQVSLELRLNLTEELIDSYDELMSNYTHDKLYIKKQACKYLEENKNITVSYKEVEEVMPEIKPELNLIHRLYVDAFAKREAYKKLNDTLTEAQEKRDEYYNSTLSYKAKYELEKEIRKEKEEKLTSFDEIEKEAKELSNNYTKLELLYNRTRGERDALQYNYTSLKDVLKYVPEHGRFVQDQVHYFQANDTLDPDYNESAYHHVKEAEKSTELQILGDYYKDMKDRPISEGSWGDFFAFTIYDTVTGIVDGIKSTFTGKDKKLFTPDKTTIIETK